MKFAVIGEHRDCLRKQGWIEFDELLTLDQLAIIEKETTLVLANRLKEPVNKIFKLPSEELFSSGKDLWRESQSLKKIVLSKTLAEVASELIEYKPLRYGYDLLLPSPSKPILYNQGSLSAILTQTPTLEEISCVQGLRCGLILCIQSSQPIDNENKSFFSNQPGNGVFFRPDTPIPFNELTKHAGNLYLMLVYTDAKAVYRMEPNDPHVNNFKKIGYNFGDKLTDTLNPLVFS